jgi:glyoxylase-like metal-dependent hydrolase (beta-lactamase superfamily II)
MEILPNIHLVPDSRANPYLLIDPDGLTLIDAGLPGVSRKILAYIASLGFTPKDLKRILITHADFDHVSGLADLQAASGARVYASQIEAAAILTGKPSRGIRPPNPFIRILMGAMSLVAKTKPVPTDEILHDGQVLPILGGLTVLETPGHTPGHLSFYAAEAAVLFCGDSIVVFNDGSLRGSRPGLTWDDQAAAASVRSQAALGAHTVCSGHGPVATNITPEKFPQ